MRKNVIVGGEVHCEGEFASREYLCRATAKMAL